MAKHKLNYLARSHGLVVKGEHLQPWGCGGSNPGGIDLM